MFGLPQQFVIFDLEWTAWEGSLERMWSNEGEIREIYDLGAVLVNGKTLEDRGIFHRYVKLDIVGMLPEYSTNLTGIKQDDLNREGAMFSKVLAEFSEFCGERSLYHWGTEDGKVIAENCRVKGLENPFAGRTQDIKPIFRKRGVETDKYHSGEIVLAFGKEPRPHKHQADNDAMSVLDGLKELAKKEAGKI